MIIVVVLLEVEQRHNFFVGPFLTTLEYLSPVSDLCFEVVMYLLVGEVVDKNEELQNLRVHIVRRLSLA